MVRVSWKGAEPESSQDNLGIKKFSPNQNMTI
jgi:hypothetical protein